MVQTASASKAAPVVLPDRSLACSAAVWAALHPCVLAVVRSGVRHATSIHLKSCPYSRC